MCQLSKKTYDGCGHKGKTICLDICNGCKRDGIDYTCTDVKNRKIEHQWIDGKCYGCRGVDPPASEQADTSDDEYDQDMERLGVSKGLSRYPHPPNGKPYRKGPELARPNGSSRKRVRMMLFREHLSVVRTWTFPRRSKMIRVTMNMTRTWSALGYRRA